jgi:glycosyltransferase involved in cell wall biosynthesis
VRVALANYTLSMMRGGGETRDLAIANELRKLGVSVELLTIKPLLGRVRYPVEGMACRYLDAPYFRDLVYRLMLVPRAGRLASFLLRQDIVRFSRKLIDLFSDPSEAIDVLQAAGLYPVVELKRRRDVAVVIRNQGGLPPVEFRHYLRQADAVIGDGWDVDNFQRRLGRELIEIPGGVDLQVFRRTRGGPSAGSGQAPSAGSGHALRAGLGLVGAEVVLFVGRFAPLKNVSLLIEAFTELRRLRPRARLVLVGEGALEARLRAEARRRGVADDVLFIGAKSVAELPAFYSMADVFALPSSFDNSPNVLLEAMACELPVVATRVGGVPRYVTDGVNGLLVEPGQSGPLAAALSRVLDEPGLRSQLVQGGLQQVRHGRSWAASARELLALYERLVSRSTLHSVG